MTEMKQRATCLALLMFALLAAPVRAQQPAGRQPQAQPPTAAQEGFVPVDQLPKPQDTIPAPRLVAAAYGFVWVAVLVYVWSVRRRLTTVEREMQAIGRRVARTPLCTRTRPSGIAVGILNRYSGCPGPGQPICSRGMGPQSSDPRESARNSTISHESSGD